MVQAQRCVLCPDCHGQGRGREPVPSAVGVEFQQALRERVAPHAALEAMLRHFLLEQSAVSQQ